ncbi:MAG: MATE family efflux transporter [Gracilimonas sp.]|uniref:MATE family efflux transporter n=1 Tax=Gracilimonas TaxID=649462 RepID=UPI001AFD3501|nr:MATE family efflux transporter [Gracilimonas sp.]MBO6584604.1 MATE family efflux transporter [Gracilimonas sp.]MBO6616125.1 MATE family efflux transporter [Gracilimonas sp.]
MNRKILRLAIPNIISNLSVPLLGAIDTAVVGRLEHVYYLGAIAVGSIIFDFIFWGFGFLRMGTTGMVAQAYGAQEERKTRIILFRVLLVAAASSLLILLIQYPLIEVSLYLVNASPEVEEYTRLYYHIRIFAAPATLALFGLNGWFLGMQNSTYPMIVTIFLNLVNIALNLIFVFRFNMTVDGVATGSLVASFLALGLAFILYKRRYGGVKLNIKWDELIEAEELKKFFSVNRDIVIRTLCLIFSYAFFTAKSAAMGDVVLAANTILLQMWYISSYGTDGFAYAAESLVGRFKGAKDDDKLKKAVTANMLWGLGLGLLGTITYAFFDAEIISLFTDKENVITVAMGVVIWLIVAPVVNSVCFIWDGIYIGATATGAMRNSMLVATVLVFIPVYFISEPFAGIHALWMAMTAFMVARGVVLSVYAPSRIFGKR